MPAIALTGDAVPRATIPDSQAINLDSFWRVYGKRSRPVSLCRFSAGGRRPAGVFGLKNEGQQGIAISTTAGVAAYVDLEDFAEGREAALGPLREALTNACWKKSVHV